jgi:hypothetical protein
LPIFAEERSMPEMSVLVTGAWGDRPGAGAELAPEAVLILTTDLMPLPALRLSAEHLQGNLVYRSNSTITIST